MYLKSKDHYSTCIELKLTNILKFEKWLFLFQDLQKFGVPLHCIKHTYFPVTHFVTSEMEIL